MHARMTTLEGPPDRMDEGVREIREDVLPQLQQQDGFKGFLALGERQSGKLVGITFWGSEPCGPPRKWEIVRAGKQRRTLATQ
jgi:hypothetical protein